MRVRASVKAVLGPCNRFGPRRSDDQRVPLFQLIARRDPLGGDDLREGSAVASNCEDLLFERGIDICHETVRLWWNRFGPMFAAEIQRKRVDQMHAYTHQQWHLAKVYVKINGEMRYLGRAVDDEGDLLASHVTESRGKSNTLNFLKKIFKL